MACTGTHTLTQADIDRGSVENTATVEQRPDGTQRDRADEQVPLGRVPDVTLVKDGTLDQGPDRADAGDRIIYTLTATNAGNVTLTGDVSRSATRCWGAGVPPQPATLAPGEQLVCTGSYTLTQADLNAGRSTTRRLVTATQTPPTEHRSAPTPCRWRRALTLRRAGQLDMKVVAPRPSRRRRRQIDYTLTATNTGNVTITGVRRHDPPLGSRS